MKSKKAESQNVITSNFMFMILYVIAVAFTVVGLSIFFRAYHQKIASPPENLEGFMLEKRFFSTPDCFMHENEEGIVEYSKFSPERLNKCYAGSEKTPAYLLRLSTYEGDKVAEEIKTSNWIDDKKMELAVFKEVGIFKDGKIVKGGIAVEKQSAG